VCVCVLQVIYERWGSHGKGPETDHRQDKNIVKDTLFCLCVLQVTYEHWGLLGS